MFDISIALCPTNLLITCNTTARILHQYASYTPFAVLCVFICESGVANYGSCVSSSLCVLFPLSQIQSESLSHVSSKMHITMALLTPPFISWLVDFVALYQERNRIDPIIDEETGQRGRMDDSRDDLKRALALREQDPGLDHLSFIFLSCEFSVFCGLLKSNIALTCICGLLHAPKQTSLSSGECCRLCNSDHLLSLTMQWLPVIRACTRSGGGNALNAAGACLSPRQMFSSAKRD